MDLGQELDAWLDLRNKAFARERLGVRRWLRTDFEREISSKSWWNSSRTWVAVVENAPPIASLAGTVTWADRTSDGHAAKPVVHWLAVLPAWRRRGIGRLLVTQMHQACWDAGHREIWLETHAAWQAAVRLYRALGYCEA